MCAYESVRNKLPRVRAFSIEPFGFTPVNGESPDGIREVGIYNPPTIRGKMAVYFTLKPELSKTITEDKEVCEKALGDNLTISKDGRIQKPRFLSIKRDVAIISSGPKSKEDVTFLVYDKTGAEYVENLLESLLR